jgi:branched-chain amino acid transport system ATP-binding protein
MNALEVDSIDVHYGNTPVIRDLSLEIPEESLTTVIGRNGAGKTTTLRAIFGIVPPTEGIVRYFRDDITDSSAFQTARHGISFVPEDRRVFPGHTVRENLRMGYIGARSERSASDIYETVYDYFPRLEERTAQMAGTLSGGEQQMLTIGRGLMSDPDLLLIDEPTEGLMPKLVTELRQILRQINEDGMTVLLVEQNVTLALAISDYGYVIENGKLKLEGVASELQDNEQLQELVLL